MTQNDARAVPGCRYVYLFQGVASGMKDNVVLTMTAAGDPEYVDVIK